MKRFLIDKLGLHLDTYTWYRYGLLNPFLIRGRIRCLNIGTGGGMETLRLLRLENDVTTIEIDEKVARSTRERIERNGYAEKHVGINGHILNIFLEQKFHQILMCEVLEHIVDDLSVLKRLRDWMLPGGRLILSTPTASYGQFSGGSVQIKEEGGHVRVGYEGPELDEMLEQVGFKTVRRVYNGGRMIQWQHRAERALRRGSTRYAGYVFSVFCRPFLPVLGFEQSRPSNQITLAVKKYW